MSYTQFWEDDADIFWVYLEAYEQEQKAKFEYDNSIAFLQGQYFMMAIAQCLQFSKHPKKIYPRKPFDINKDETSIEIKQLQFEEERKAEMRTRCKMFNRIRRVTNNG